MAKYKVTINAVITKTIDVEASDRETAEQKASELFTIYRDKSEEKYEQETVSIEEAA